jgi:hypothetical protein
LARFNKKLKAVLNYGNSNKQKDNSLSNTKLILPIYLDYLKHYDKDIITDKQIEGYILILDSYKNYSRDNIQVLKDDLDKILGVDRIRILSSTGHPSIYYILIFS